MNIDTDEFAQVPGGWVVAAQRRDGRTAKRHYLVAISDGNDAVAATVARLGPQFNIEVSGPAAAVHFIRRRMKPGDVMALGQE